MTLSRFRRTIERLPATKAVEQVVPLEKWQALEAIWKTILGLEASIDTSRLGMESLRSEMESAYKQTLTVEDKLHALQADVAQWNKAKSRVHYALPKVREFVHRATFALAVPERKRLDEIYRNHIEPRVPLPDLDQLREQLEHLQKDRQVLFAQGNAVYQECRGITVGDSEGPEHAPEKRGRQSPREAERQAREGQVLLTLAGAILPRRAIRKHARRDARLGSELSLAAPGVAVLSYALGYAFLARRRGFGAEVEMARRLISSRLDVRAGDRLLASGGGRGVGVRVRHDRVRLHDHDHRG